MNKSGKNLKEASILVLIFAALSLVRMIFQFFVVGFDIDPAQAGTTPAFVQVMTIIMFVISLCLLLPELYVGLKGLKVAKKPNSDKGHIVWAIILLVFAAFGVLSSISGIAETVSVDSITALVDHILDVIVYCMFIKYANQVLKGV